jgi:hypothetical protein
MSYIVYDRIKGTGKEAHQHVIIDGIRIGEIWRQQVSQETPGVRHPMKWRWFALSYRNVTQAGASSPLAPTGFGTKDKAVDALEDAFRGIGYSDLPPIR